VGGIPALAALDVEAATITRASTVDGGPFPASVLENGEILLIGPHGDLVSLGETRFASPDPVLVVDGSYDVHYRWLAGSMIVPANLDALVARSLSITQDGTLAVNVPTVEITPAFTVDGVPFPASILERGDFTLVGEMEGDIVSLGSSHDSPAAVRIIPGRYDVVYDWQAGGMVVPRSHRHTVVEDQDLTATQVLNLEMPTKLVLPTFLLNGAPFPTDALDRGDFLLRAPAGGELDLGSSHIASPVSVRAIEGLYFIEYRWAAGASVPRNVGRVLGVTEVPEPGVASGLVAGALFLGLLSRGRLKRRNATTTLLVG
jgi:hypothetical protein